MRLVAILPRRVGVEDPERAVRQRRSGRCRVYVCFDRVRERLVAGGDRLLRLDRQLRDLVRLSGVFLLMPSSARVGMRFPVGTAFLLCGGLRVPPHLSPSAGWRGFNGSAADRPRKFLGSPSAAEGRRSLGQCDGEHSGRPGDAHGNVTRREGHRAVGEGHFESTRPTTRARRPALGRLQRALRVRLLVSAQRRRRLSGGETAARQGPQRRRLGVATVQAALYSRTSNRTPERAASWRNVSSDDAIAASR